MLGVVLLAVLAVVATLLYFFYADLKDQQQHIKDFPKVLRDAHAGDVLSQFKLVQIYRSDGVVPTNFEEALKWARVRDQEKTLMKPWMTCLFVALSISGCATIDTLQPGTGGSTFEVRGKSYDDIWKAVVNTASRSLTIVESNKGTGTLRAEKGAGMTTWGEVVGIFVRPISNGAPVYTVEVQSLKRSRVQITGQDWTLTMISGIKAELGQ